MKNAFAESSVKQSILKNLYDAYGIKPDTSWLGISRKIAGENIDLRETMTGTQMSIINCYKYTMNIQNFSGIHLNFLASKSSLLILSKAAKFCLT